MPAEKFLAALRQCVVEWADEKYVDTNKLMELVYEPILRETLRQLMDNVAPPSHPARGTSDSN